MIWKSKKWISTNTISEEKYLKCIRSLFLAANLFCLTGYAGYAYSENVTQETRLEVLENFNTNSRTLIGGDAPLSVEVTDEMLMRKKHHCHHHHHHSDHDSSKGRRGPRGRRGPIGLRGVAGATGPTGATGIAGPTGATGLAGAIGATGPTGPAGATGAQGIQGVAGIPGVAGAIGPTGPAGTSGTGAIIPYASGATPIVMTTLLGDLVGTTSVLGFGSSEPGITIVGGVIDTTGLSSFAFSVSEDGIITSISAYFSNSVAVALIGGSITITAQLYSSATPNDLFTPIAGASVSLTPSLTGTIAIGDTSAGNASVNLPVIAGTRLLMVYSAVPAGGIAASVITGFASAGVMINGAVF